MAPRRARLAARWLFGVLTLPGGLAARTASPTSDYGTPAVTRRTGGLPIVAEHHYRMAAKIRPLLLFWIGRDRVGGAHAVWRRSQDGAGFELLIGSDPLQAPRRINDTSEDNKDVLGQLTQVLSSRAVN